MPPSNRPPIITINNLPQISPNVIRLGILGLFGAWLAFTSYYTVPAESVGLVLRFGECQPDAKPPGLHFKAPLGIDQVVVVPVQRQLKLEFGFGTPGFTNADQPDREPHLSQQMITGDLNAALVQWVVQYRIDDAKQYLFRVRNPGDTLRDLIEAVMQEVVGDRTVDEVITIGRQDIEVAAREKLSKAVKDYELGVTIDQIQLRDVDPPVAVQDSFDEVNKAQQDKEGAINMANGDYNKAVPRARGEAQQKISSAEGAALKRINEAQGDVASFNAQLEQYIKSPEITRNRLYLETLGQVLPQAGQKIIVDDSVKNILALPGASLLNSSPKSR